MKIEKISNTQVKFLLTNKDLIDRGIKTSDFHLGSEKIKSLIKEITEQAAITCGFEPDEEGATPIMIEAIPFESDGILIIVSKISKELNISDKFNYIPATKTDRHFIESDIEESYIFSESDSDNISIYSFSILDDVEKACECMQQYYKGNSSLYKHNNRFYLIICNDNIDGISQEDFDLLISEFGQKHISNVISKGFLAEHGEIIVKDNALNIMATL